MLLATKLGILRPMQSFQKPNQVFFLVPKSNWTISTVLSLNKVENVNKVSIYLWCAEMYSIYPSDS